MTVAVSCNLSDGVILGVDSAVTLTNNKGAIIKVYENAEKLFQIEDRPIGVATFGIGSIANRSIGSYIREIEIQRPVFHGIESTPISEIVESLRDFFYNIYQNSIVPLVEAQTNKKFSEIPNERKPVLGFAVGGFSPGKYLSEVWQILIPFCNTPGSSQLCRGEGNFGGNWFALCEPIHRYFKGYDRKLLEKIKTFMVKMKGSPLNPQEESEISNIIQTSEYPVPFNSMPIEEGIAHVRFLVDMVINHHRFSLGAPVVGGKATIGLVTYKGDRFRIIEGD